MAEMKKAFDMVDTDNSGFLEKEEIRKMMDGMGDDQLNEYFTNADLDGDGKISFREFQLQLEADAGN